MQKFQPAKFLRGKNITRRNSRAANISGGKISARQKPLKIKIPGGKNSAVRNFRAANFPTGEINGGKIFRGEFPYNPLYYL